MGTWPNKPSFLHSFDGRLWLLFPVTSPQFWNVPSQMPTWELSCHPAWEEGKRTTDVHNCNIIHNREWTVERRGGLYAGCDKFSHNYALPSGKAWPHCRWGWGPSVRWRDAPVASGKSDHSIELTERMLDFTKITASALWKKFLSVQHCQFWRSYETKSGTETACFQSYYCTAIPCKDLSYQKQ